ncbi:MAG: proline--tRNA ligase [Oscillospiraceae bacterium]|nr:proline--tRNA ligase [Oscillospiraceae bacterium]
MKLKTLVSKRYKEPPADCQIASQALMMRGGYIKPVGNGIVTLFPITKRITTKIERIIREEMNRIGGQELLFPVAMPATLWRESGRFESVGSELLRFKDRSGADMVLGMTHEEAAVHFVRDVADSYTQYPFMIYQIQTKFRDEPRCRGGLIRVREFTMKDAYSFHTTQADLERYYELCYEAYGRIFARAGAPEVVAVASDSGMMGGKVSHEYMLLTPVGEDTIVLCHACDYRANMEAAPCIVQGEAGTVAALEKVSTPNIKTIEDLCAFLNISATATCKAVVYQENLTDQYVVAFLRGDLDISETKLRNHIKAEIHTADITPQSALAAGFIGPKGLPKHARIVYDASLKGINAFVTGANESDYHYIGFNIEREMGIVEYVDVAKAYDGGICPVCGRPAIYTSRGIEVGNIFQLGTKYTESMGMTYVDADGSMKYPIMGCYGIGVGRLAASVCEAHRDDYGPIWPMSIAPWQVHLCSLRADNEEVAEASQRVYDALTRRGIEVIWDDRPVSAGVMFSDADLFGVPVRVVISPKGLKNGTIEVSTRDKSMAEKKPVEEVIDFVTAYVTAELAKSDFFI